MRKVTLYTRKQCHLCEAARAVIERAREATPFDFEVVDIDSDAKLRALYDVEVPVVAIDGRPVFRHGADLDALLRRLA
jgi:glutaredoxin